MALDLASLTSGLEAVAASVDDIPSPSAAECAGMWAAAVEDYATAIVPASTTVAAAAATLESALVAAFESGAEVAPAMEIALGAFALAVGGGMAGFVATPPPAPVGFATQFATHPPTHAAAGIALGALIDTWMRTGTATPSGGGPPVAWS